MTSQVLPRLAAIALTCAATACCADGFEVRLGLSGAHLAEVFFGCRPAATDGFDRGLDELAPPPGIETGYVGFLPPANLPLFYRDVRGLEGPHEWKLYVRVHGDRPVEIAWDRTSLPAGWLLSITDQEATRPMGETASVRIGATHVVVIRAVRAAAAPDLPPAPRPAPPLPQIPVPAVPLPAPLTVPAVPAPPPPPVGIEPPPMPRQ